MRLSGTIARVRRDKGFGFIRADTGIEYFFHRSELQHGLDFQTLQEGAAVTFGLVPTSPKGPRAESVQPA